MRNNHHCAFTIIELLVVITIIVVLLALLTPAMDKAIYQAELTQCGANLRVFGQQITTYAFDHQRRYPKRPAIDDGAARHMLQMTNNVPNSDVRNYDDRVPIQDYVQINKTLNCPLGEAVDLEGPESTTIIYASYNYWYGWHWSSGGTKHKAMRRLGDRFEGRDPDNPDSPLYRFSVLAGDTDFVHKTNDHVQQTHPDKGPNPKLANIVTRNEVAAMAQVAGNAVGTAYVTRSVWAGSGRNLIDMNFVREDASVERFTDVEMRDSRLVQVPAVHPNNNDFRVYMPAN